MANDSERSMQRTVGPQTPAQHGRGSVAPVGMGEIAKASGETAATAMAVKQAALVQARFAMAQARPRDMDRVRDRMLAECARPSFADEAIYHKPVGEGIEGPSIRFVEAAIAAMGNIWCDVDTVAETDDARTVQVQVTDLETNTGHAASVTIHKTVERSSVRDGDEVLRKRVNSRGRDVYIKRATDDEILNTANALTSKALRTVGLRLIPGWLKAECMDACYATIESGAKADPDATRRKLFDSFSRAGVRVEQVKEWLGHDGSKLSPKERTVLGGIYNALVNGETTWTEVMDAKWNETLERGAASAAAAAAAASGQTPAHPGAGGLKDRVQKAAEQVVASQARPAEQARQDSDPRQADPRQDATGPMPDAPPPERDVTPSRPPRQAGDIAREAAERAQKAAEAKEARRNAPPPDRREPREPGDDGDE